LAIVLGALLLLAILGLLYFLVFAKDKENTLPDATQNPETMEPGEVESEDSSTDFGSIDPGTPGSNINSAPSLDGPPLPIMEQQRAIPVEPYKPAPAGANNSNSNLVPAMPEAATRAIPSDYASVPAAPTNQVKQVTAAPLPSPGSPSETSTTQVPPSDQSLKLEQIGKLTGPDQELAKKALATLQNFLGAKTWQERAQFSRVGPDGRSEMQNYYSTYPDAAITPSLIKFVALSRRPDRDDKFAVFNISTNDLPAPFPVIVDENNGDFKVVWRLFVEFKDDLLAKFLAGWKEQPQQFHVYMNRSHYFRTDVPDIDSKNCYLIETPVKGRRGFVFVDAGSPLAIQLETEVPWGSKSHPVLTLKWQKGSDGRAYVAIDGITRYGWGS